MITLVSIMKLVDIMRSERAIAVLMLILTNEASTRKSIASKLKCSPASVSRAITDINCSMADYLDYFFQIKYIDNKYQLVHEEYSPDYTFKNLCYILEKKC